MTHLRLHSGEKTFKCDICQAIFIQSGTLRSHLRTHGGDKPLKCDTCQASFSENNHTSVMFYKACFDTSGHVEPPKNPQSRKTLKCDICQASFSQSGTLKTHLRTYCEKIAFWCKNLSTRGPVDLLEIPQRKPHWQEYSCMIYADVAMEHENPIVQCMSSMVLTARDKCIITMNRSFRDKERGC